MTEAPLTPPARYADARFAAYRPQNASQAEALGQARTFVRLVRVRYGRPRWWAAAGLRLGLGPDVREALRGGIYLVGPVGTGKTHLLAAVYHALTAPVTPEAEPVACAFTHSSALFRSAETPDAYADRIAAQARVLCLDEVELDDPASEVRLIAVLRALRERRVTLAATSNAEPDAFVSAAFGRDRLERFITEEFSGLYHVVGVGGADYRQGLDKPGTAWIGPPDATRTAMRAAFEAAPEPKRWLTFADLLALTTAVERTRLAADLAQSRALFVDGVRITSTDDALRLLRVADDLYGLPDPPVLSFTSEAEPAGWFTSEGARGIERAIADKFLRTTSRLTALAEVRRVG